MTSQTDPGTGLDWDPFPGQSFGVNGALVWIFLDELRALDLDRGIEVWDAYAVAQERGHAQARAAAEHVANKQRPQAWAAAREAASIAVRERLGASPVTTEVADILADVAGSLVVRDLLSRPEFRLLQLPWTWHGGAAEPAVPELPALEDVLARPAPAASAEIPVVESAPLVHATPGFEAAPMPEDAAAIVAPAYADPWASPSAAAFNETATRRQPFRAVTATADATARPTVGASLSRAADQLAGNRLARTAVRAIVVIAVVSVLAIVTRLAPDAALVGPSDSEVPGSGALLGTGPTPGSSAFALASPSTRPSSTSSAPGSTPRPNPTKAPTATSAPPPPPAPTPRPTPVPTPTPKAVCTVPLLIGLSTAQAQHRWNDAGFTGTVFFSPAPPPNYKIQSQSLTPGSKTTCTHDVNVTDHAP